MSDESRSQRWLIPLLWGLAVIPSLIGVVTELNKTHLVWYIRLVDFCDLVVTAPFYLATFLCLHALIVRRERRFSYWLGFALIGMFMYGHAMHLAANAVNTYSTEIRDYEMLIPPDSYALLYFFDENLGHWILFAAYFGLLGIWLWEDHFTGQSPIQSVLAGIVLGVALAIGMIESSHPWLGPVASVFFLGLAILRSSRERRAFMELWRSRPVGSCVLASSVTILLAELVYWLAVGSLIEPSELGL